MRSRLNILIFIIIYFILCGKSCDDDDAQTTWQERQVTMAKDSILNEFEADYLSEEARYAAEINAAGKLNDLADYVNIYADIALDSAFRTKAADMIRGLFDSEDDGLSFGAVSKRKMKNTTVGEFLVDGFGEGLSKVNVVFDSVRVLEPLNRSGIEAYSGRLLAYQSVICISLTDSVLSDHQPVIVDFTSIKQEKMIGNDTLKVWAVFLTGLKPEGKSP